MNRKCDHNDESETNHRYAYHAIKINSILSCKILEYQKLVKNITIMLPIEQYTEGPNQ